MHYCNQPVLEISLDLNVVSSILQLLISFLEAPWQGLVYYVLAINTAGRGRCVTS